VTPEDIMHKIAIPKSVVERVIARRGREFVYDNLDPRKTALVVVDMQNAFMLPGVAHTLCPTAREIVPNINWLAQAVRETGGTVVWIKTTYTPETLKDWSTHYELSGPEQSARRAQALAAGSKGHELWAELDAGEGDLTVEKQRFSAFIQGSSDLAEVLRERDIDTVIVTGTVTGVCCESTARDAMMCNFKTIMVTDGNAAMTDEDHNASLASFYLTFGDVMPTNTVIEFLRRNADKRLAAAE
jgi:ureidoacrylate peracid hydrolase